MQEKSKEPEIRFAGFTGAWEQRKLGALLDEYKVSIPTPHDGYTRLGIRSHAKGTFHEYVPKGRELETKEMNKVAKDKLILNITFAWEHAVAITDEKDEGALVSHRFPQFTLHPEIIPNFLKYVILDESFRHHLYLASPGGAGRNRVLKISQMLEYAIKYPSTAEQLRISNLLDSINSLITLHQRKYEKLLNIKKSMLEKMFPKEGEVVPEIRFKGFTGAWEQRKLGALLDEYKVSIPTPHDGYTRLGIRSHAKGTFHEYVPKGRELETKEMNKVAKDKLILNITFAWEHAVAITDEKDEGALVSHRFPQFTLHPEIIPNFLKYVILDESFRHHLYLASPGGAGRNRVLKISQMLEYAIKYPSTAEQLRISNLLDSINSLITLHQRKLEMLKNVKQAFLEKMFV